MPKKTITVDPQYIQVGDVLTFGMARDVLQEITPDGWYRFQSCQFTNIALDLMIANGATLTREVEEDEPLWKWRPKIGERCLNLDSCGDIAPFRWDDDSIDRGRFAQGNVAPDTPEGRRYLEAVAEMRRWMQRAGKDGPIGDGEPTWWWHGTDRWISANYFPGYASDRILFLVRRRTDDNPPTETPDWLSEVMPK